MTIDEILEYVADNPRTSQRDSFDHEQRHSIVTAAVEEDISAVRKHFDLPQDLIHLWERAASLHLFEDHLDWQSGLVILTPSDVLHETASLKEQCPKDVLPGDLAVGAFRGNHQRVLVRCDRGAPDYGHVLIALPIDYREAWPIVGESLAYFLSRFIAAGGDYYWPHRLGNHFNAISHRSLGSSFY